MLNLHDKILKTEGGAFSFYEAEFNGDLCYAIQHRSGYVLIMDRNKRIFKEIVRISNQCNLSFYFSSGIPIFKFNNRGAEKYEKYNNTSLRTFLCTRYNKMKIEDVSRRRIGLHDETMLSDKILDFRSGNLYLPGDPIAIKKDTQTYAIDDPVNSGHKLILIKSKLHDNYLDYSDELYDMLISGALCYPFVHNKRLQIIVRYGHSVEDTVTVLLSRFAYIFYTRFSSYKNMKGGVTRFIHDFKKLNDELGNDEIAHINSITWINLKSNLKRMSADTNNALRDYTRDFISDDFQMSTALNDQGEILIECRKSVIGFNGVQAVKVGNLDKRYYRCKTDEDFLGWIMLSTMRLDILDGMNNAVVTDNTGTLKYQILTQSGIRANNTEKVKYEPTIEEYLRDEKTLRSLDDSVFFDVDLPIRKNENGAGYDCDPEVVRKYAWLLVPTVGKILSIEQVSKN